jgi:hypothetical protein
MEFGKDVNLDFITAFWWIETDEIYFVVEENKETPRIGRIYFLDPKNIDKDQKEWLHFPVSIE